MMKNLNTPWKTLVESWVKLHCAEVEGKPAAILENTRPNMLVLSMPTNPWEYDWKVYHNGITKIISLQKDQIHHLKIPDAQGSSGKRMEKTREIPAWQLTKVINKKGVIDEARNDGHTVHFASLMDLCHLENSELQPQFQKYKGRVVLRGDILKDDSGSYAVFTEQWSSASQMTAAKVMDIIFKLPRCAGHAADAVSSKTQVKMEDAPTLLKIPKSECSDIWIRQPKHKWPKLMVQYGRPSCSSWAESVRLSFGRTIVETAIWDSSIEIGLGKGSK